MIKKYPLLILFIFSSFFILSGCNSENDDNIKLASSFVNRSYLINTEYIFEGTSSINGTVRVYLNDEFITESQTTDKAFSFLISFSNNGINKVKIQLLDSDEKVIAKNDYNLKVDDPNSLFSFHFPEYEGGESKTLWATYYYLPQVYTIENGYPLLDGSGNPLGPELSRIDWCNAAMEGSVYVIDRDDKGTTYNYFSETGQSQADCSDLFDTDVSKTRFRLAFGPYGDGVEDYKLIPYRTIAVDPKYFPYGSVIYIPRARGNKITLPDGSVTYHDGYFFAGDTGRAILNTHIDVYIGVAEENPFEWVRSYEDQTFKAMIVTDKEIIESLTKIHK